MATEPYRSASQIARLLGVSAKTVHRLAERGQVPRLRVGEQWRYRWSEVESALRVEPHRPQEQRAPDAPIVEDYIGAEPW